MQELCRGFWDGLIILVLGWAGNALLFSLFKIMGNNMVPIFNVSLSDLCSGTHQSRKTKVN